MSSYQILRAVLAKPVLAPGKKGVFIDWGLRKLGARELARERLLPISVLG